ncbi:MAG TPA: hypothetical protein VMR33_14995 [Candidatus Baltobacteraceae bacterium]|jgi:hypothetical protein|nr:hypothetical protein [Candidatus Baltobacteraceae bacterium]
MKYPFIAIAAAVLLCGCFTSEKPFYQQGDIVTDDRLVGTYDGGKPYHWEVRKADEGSYDVTVVGVGPNKSCLMEFTGVLFRLGTNQFIDLLPVIKACDHTSEGTAPALGLIEMLQAATIQPLHLVVKVHIGINEIGVGGLNDQWLQFAKQDAEEFFLNWRGPIPPLPRGPLRMNPDTQLQRAFLVRFGSDTNKFLFETMKRL